VLRAAVAERSFCGNISSYRFPLPSVYIYIYTSQLKTFIKRFRTVQTVRKRNCRDERMIKTEEGKTMKFSAETEQNEKFTTAQSY
jgi:hypothetical protein